MTDDEFLNKLIPTFQAELEEKLQIITDGLLALERASQDPNHFKTIIEEVFRAAHNIKGSARGVGVNDVGEIAHRIESIFAALRDGTNFVSPDLISLCLLAVDCMHSAMSCFCDKKPLNFNLSELLTQLQKGEFDNSPSTSSPQIEFLSNKKLLEEDKEHKTIRVSLHQIDYISSLLEDLQINKISIEEHNSELIKLTTQINQRVIHSFELTQLAELTSSLHRLHKNMNISVNALNTILNLLQEEVRMLRLLPASSLLKSTARSMRDLAIELGKKVDIRISGDGIKMDKMILEGLKDPLTHLLRNAIDHGIESKELRKRNGKLETGTISIDLIDDGDHIIFNISDDGAGIDYKMIAQMALEKKIISPSDLEKLKDHEIVDLIFQSGFSTKEIITDVSGRGVGLDVVKNNLAYIKGDVRVETEQGKGTCFKLRVPLTVSSDRGLIIVSGGQLLMIPISTIEHVIMIHPNEIIEVESNQVILFNGQPVALRTLSELLKLEPKESFVHDLLSIVILKKDKKIVALLVEQIIGEREMVIKPLSPPLVDIPCVTGGALAGNGEVMVVLNAHDVIHMAMHSGVTKRINSSVATLNTDSRHHILLVDDSITTRTLEKNVLENNNYKVTVAVDGKEAWELLLKESYSLLITDIEMPNMDGIELTTRVKQHDKLSILPVIIVTSLGSDTQKKQGVEAGADAYIVKNHFESKELLDIVAQLI